MVQRYEQMRRLQWYKRGAAYNDNASCNCDITSHKARLIHREDGNYFMAIATVSTQGQNTPILQKYMKADVRIIVSNKTLWQQVFG